MSEFLQILLAALVAFVAMHYTLTVAKLSEPAKIIIAVVFAVLVAIFMPVTQELMVD